MVTNTSSLTHSDPRQSTTSKINNKSFFRMLPMLLINAVVPFLINLLATSYMSSIDALLLASSVPAVFTLGNFIWKKRIDAIGVIVVASLLLTAVFALLFNSPRLLLLPSSAVSGLFGIVMLVSLLFSRPILFYIMRSIITQNDPQRLVNFNADWSFPQVRSFYRILTIVWGCVTVGQLLLRIILVFDLPISLMLVLSPILTFGAIIPAAHWSMRYVRKNKAIFEQIHKQRDMENLEIC